MQEKSQSSDFAGSIKITAKTCNVFCDQIVPGNPKKYSCLIKCKMYNKRGIFKIPIVLNYQ